MQISGTIILRARVSKYKNSTFTGKQLKHYTVKSMGMIGIWRFQKLITKLRFTGAQLEESEPLPFHRLCPFLHGSEIFNFLSIVLK